MDRITDQRFPDVFLSLSLCYTGVQGTKEEARVDLFLNIILQQERNFLFSRQRPG